MLNSLHHWGPFLAGNLTGKNDLSIILFHGSNEQPLLAYKPSLYVLVVVFSSSFFRVWGVAQQNKMGAESGNVKNRNKETKQFYLRDAAKFCKAR